MTLKSKRARFIASQPLLSDDEFASRVGVEPELRKCVLAVREALGRICHVPACHIHPEDEPELLAELVWDWDDMDVILELEQLLDTPVADEDFPRFLMGRFFWRKWPGPKSVGDWAIRVAEHLHPQLDAQSPS